MTGAGPGPRAEVAEPTVLSDLDDIQRIPSAGWDRLWRCRRPAKKKYSELDVAATPAVVKGAKPKRTPLPVLPMVVIYLIQLSEAFGITVLFPFVVFMLRDFGIAEERIGSYAGALAASFSFCQFLSSSFWGWLSDRTSRRTTLQVGLVGASIGTLVFGTAPNIYFAFAGRCLAGLLNGNIGVMKALLSDMTDDTNRGFAFSVLPGAWGLGCVIAPVLGGLLARPAVQYGGDWGPFSTYPYLLPCLGGVATQMLGFSISFVLPKNSQSAYSSIPDDGANATGEVELVVVATAAAESDEEAEEVRASDSPQLQPAEDMAPLTKAEAKKESVLCNKLVWGAIAGYACTAMTYTILDEVVPVWATAHKADEGLAFTPAQVGVILGISGVELLIITLVISPYVTTHVPYKRALFWGSVAAIPLHLSLPLVDLIADWGTAWVWGVMSVYMFTRMFVATTVFTAAMVMVNNSVESRHVGAVNGLAQSVAALVRAAGPALGGALWSLGIILGFYGHAYLPFIPVVLLQMCAAIVAHLLPHSLQFKKQGAGAAAVPMH